MHKRYEEQTDRSLKLILGIVILTAALFIVIAPPVHAATSVSSRFDKISNSAPNATSIHIIGFTYTDFSVPIGSVQLQFCANDPIPEAPCTLASGFDLSGSTLTNQTGETGFTRYSGSTQNSFILTRPAVIPTNGASTYELSGVLNPNYEGSYYLRILTYTSIDATGAAVQAGGVALSSNNPFTVSTEVPPYLNFCTGLTITDYDCATASGFLVDLGELSKTQTKVTSSQMVASTNAVSGYSITLSGTTFTSGNNTVAALSNPTPSAPGTSQFGINLRRNTQPDIGSDPQGTGTATVRPDYDMPNNFKFLAGDSIASGMVAQNYRKFTVSYIVNISAVQPPGFYATTLTYICLANF